jgi:hypothetical protein
LIHSDRTPVAQMDVSRADRFDAAGRHSPKRSDRARSVPIALATLFDSERKNVLLDYKSLHPCASSPDISTSCHKRSVFRQLFVSDTEHGGQAAATGNRARREGSEAAARSLGRRPPVFGWVGCLGLVWYQPYVDSVFGFLLAVLSHVSDSLSLAHWTNNFSRALG